MSEVRSKFIEASSDYMAMEQERSPRYRSQELLEELLAEVGAVGVFDIAREMYRGFIEETRGSVVDRDQSDVEFIPGTLLYRGFERSSDTDPDNSFLSVLEEFGVKAPVFSDYESSCLNLSLAFDNMEVLEDGLLYYLEDAHGRLPVTGESRDPQSIRQSFYETTIVNSAALGSVGPQAVEKALSYLEQDDYLDESVTTKLHSMAIRALELSREADAYEVLSGIAESDISTITIRNYARKVLHEQYGEELMYEKDPSWLEGTGEYDPEAILTAPSEGYMTPTEIVHGGDRLLEKLGTDVYNSQSRVSSLQAIVAYRLIRSGELYKRARERVETQDEVPAVAFEILQGEFDKVRSRVKPRFPLKYVCSYGAEFEINKTALPKEDLQNLRRIGFPDANDPKPYHEIKTVPTRNMDVLKRELYELIRVGAIKERVSLHVSIGDIELNEDVYLLQNMLLASGWGGVLYDEHMEGTGIKESARFGEHEAGVRDTDLETFGVGLRVGTDLEGTSLQGIELRGLPAQTNFRGTIELLECISSLSLALRAYQVPAEKRDAVEQELAQVWVEFRNASVDIFRKSELPSPHGILHPNEMANLAFSIHDEIGANPNGEPDETGGLVGSTRKELIIARGLIKDTFRTMLSE